jgi:hypothetical protein
LAVLKNKTQGNYTIVSQNIMRDKDLSLTERGMLITLLSLPDNWHFTIMGLCQILPDGKERISRTLNSLISKGYVTRIQGRGEKGQFDSTDLEVHETPVRTTNPPGRPSDYDEETQCTSDFSPYPENPDTVNRDTDNPYAENPAQYNTNKSNIQTLIPYKECNRDTLTDQEYEKLVSEFGKANVDYQIQRIKDHGYKGCYNYETIRLWCRERKNRPAMIQNVQPKKNSFGDFPQRTDIDFEALERRKLLGRAL